MCVIKLSPDKVPSSSITFNSMVAFPLLGTNEYEFLWNRVLKLVQLHRTVQTVYAKLSKTVSLFSIKNGISNSAVKQNTIALKCADYNSLREECSSYSPLSLSYVHWHCNFNFYSSPV